MVMALSTLAWRRASGPPRRAPRASCRNRGRVDRGERDEALDRAGLRDVEATRPRRQGGEPVTSAPYWHVAETSSALLEALTEAVLNTAWRELEQE